MKPKVVITGVIGSDSHMVGTKLLSYALNKAGFKVISLGACVSQEEFIHAAIESNADAILVSSLYGMAALDCEGFREKCQETGLNDIKLYIGGHLMTHQQDWEVTEKLFSDLGFDRVYPPNTSVTNAINELKQDLDLNSTKE